MSNYNIIDSNVIAIANGLQTDASLQCQQNTIYFLQHIQEIVDRNECILIYDDRYIILNECQKHCTITNKNKVGSAFLKWVFRNKNFTEKFIFHNLPTDIDDNNDLLPPCFARFDVNDKKYLFLALYYKEFRPTLNYGIDRGYPRYNQCFIDEGIVLSSLC